MDQKKDIKGCGGCCSGCKPLRCHCKCQNCKCNKKQTMTQITLFARYKRMINLMWEDGQRRYTSQELNIHVGQYEASSSWKRLYNNPYYTTRNYQTMLKQLGCIKKIKRGLWEINAPIPSWFSSLHLYALLNTGSRQSLEKSSNVRNNLVPQHKINTWAKPTNTYRVIENTVISNVN